MKLIALIAAGCLAVPFALSAASPAPVAPLPSLAPATWEVDAVHSAVVFKVLHVGVSNFYGRFNKLTGTVVMNDEKPAESKVELTIPTDSVDTNNDDRNKHLMSPDFFNAKEFPEIKFVSKSAKKDGDKKWKVDGDLTLHGVTKPLSVVVDMVGTADTIMGKRAGFDVTFKVKRSDFGMKEALDTLGDEITVMAGIECAAK
ncbi:MAG TPA: YceI family protein [Planctomycetota bacterium]|nr:YceI family protein [Planctomycetota bacterium]